MKYFCYEMVLGNKDPCPRTRFSNGNMKLTDEAEAYFD